MVLTVVLKNPPSEATHWGIAVSPWSGSDSVGTQEALPLNIGAVLNVPDGWSTPFRFYVYVFYYDAFGGVVPVYQAQSMKLTLPHYIEEFMYPPYDYFYNVTSEKLEWRIDVGSTYELTTSVQGNGSVSPSEGTYNSGDQIIISATPVSGNEFLAWSGDINGCTPVIGRPESLRVTMDRDRHIVAEFIEGVTKYTLTTAVVPDGAGTITREPSSVMYVLGTTVILTALPASGYIFVGWAGSIQSSENPVEITMDEDKSIAAAFEEGEPGTVEPEFDNFGVVDYSL